MKWTRWFKRRKKRKSRKSFEEISSELIEQYNLKPSTPKPRRNYGAIPAHLKEQFQAIKSSYMFGIELKPCSVKDKDGRIFPCVLIVNAEPYAKMWANWPEDMDVPKRCVFLKDVVSIFPSPYRLPLKISQRLYDEGESCMGGTFFTLIFRDGFRQAYSTGNLLDFIFYPEGEGRGPEDIVDAEFHTRDEIPKLQTPFVTFCLYGEGEGD